MAGPVRYLSGRQNKLKIGIPDYRTEDTSLVVLGRVGIGTTNATSDLYVKGGGEFTGVVTATKFDGTFENVTLTGVTTTQQFNTTVIEKGVLKERKESFIAPYLLSSNYISTLKNHSNCEDNSLKVIIY